MSRIARALPAGSLLPFIAHLAVMATCIVAARVGLTVAPQDYVNAIFPAAGLALGAVLVGSGWLRRTPGFPIPLDQASDVLCFLLIVPASCLVGASISVAGLLVVGVITLDSSLPLWAASWMGSTLGILAVLPLLLVAFAEPRPLWRRRAWTVGAPTVLGVALFAVFFTQNNHLQQEQSLAEFRGLSQQLADRIQTDFSAQESLLEQVDGLFSGLKEPSADDFQRIMHKSLARLPMVRAVEWAPEIDAASRQFFESRQASIRPGFAIRERGRDGAVEAASERDRYFPVTYVEPLFGNETALGFDLASTTERRNTLEAALAGSSAVATPPLRLVQERGEQIGALLFQAVTGKDGKRGVALTVLRMGDFMENILPFAQSMLYVRLIDTDAGQTVYDNFAENRQETRFERDFRFGGRRYRLQAAPTAAYLAEHPHWQSWGVLAFGLIGMSTLAGLLLLGTGYTARVEALVEQKTRRIAESEARFRKIIERAPIGMSVVSLSGQLLTVNKALCNILRYPKEELVRLSFQDIVVPEDLAPSLHNLEKLLIGECETCEAERRYRRKDASIVWVLLTVSLLRDEYGNPLELIAQVKDISARKKTEAELLLAASVFQNTMDGVMVTDADARIVSVNPAFSEITGYSSEEAIGQKPSLIRSNHHGPDFYRHMWSKLLGEGRWEGEMWNRRKNGELFLEWLTVSAVCSSNGKTERYVGVFNDITEMRRKDDAIRHQAFHDALTGLPNRSLLLDRLIRRTEFDHREQGRMALMFIDLDRFKAINDSLGHDFGDKLLKEIAARLERCVRRSDTVARMGGDEFVVMLERVGELEDCNSLATKIISELSQPMALGGHTVQVGASVGIACFPEDGADAYELMKRADVAMYAAKSAGRGTYCFFQTSMTEKAVQRLKLEMALRGAVQNGELQLFFQPKVLLRNNALVGVEALVRWRHPELGLIPPCDFIPLAEETGIICELGEWVLDEACRQAADWLARGMGRIRVAVNMSAKQLAQEDMADRVLEVIGKHRVAPLDLEFELTESAVMANPEKIAGTFARLRKHGITIAVDDFGTGYSSLSYLRRLPIDVLKIDRSFVMNSEHDVADAQIVRTILDLGHSLGIEVVAEGVETLTQAKLLIDLGCHIGQGYLYAHPMPASEFEAWLDSRSLVPLGSAAQSRSPKITKLEQEPATS